MKSVYVEAPDKSSDKRKQKNHICYDLIGFIPVDVLTKAEQAWPKSCLFQENCELLFYQQEAYCACDEKELGFSFLFPFDVDEKQIFEFVKLLRREGFYH